MALFIGDMTYVYFLSDVLNADTITDTLIGYERSAVPANQIKFYYYGNFTYDYDTQGNKTDYGGVIQNINYSYLANGLVDQAFYIGSIAVDFSDVKTANFEKDLLLPKIFSGNDLVRGVQGPAGSLDPDEVLNGYAGNDAIYGYHGNDRIDGGEGADRLDGGTGADILTGRTGNDTYFLDNGADRIVERAGEGYDKAASSVTCSLKGADVEALLLTGGDAVGAVANALDNKLVGNDADNKMQAMVGNDALYGGVGRDALYGGPGNDAFVFDKALGTNNVDAIYDFANAAGDDDTIRLDNAVFSALTATGRLAETAFASIASSSAIVSVDARILYNQASGVLSYDPDGGGSSGRVAFAVLANHAALAHLDFLVI